eukprot:SAG22_NODE_112_length_19423_cov_11.462223_7_plen_95_part_00
MIVKQHLFDLSQSTFWLRSNKCCLTITTPVSAAKPLRRVTTPHRRKSTRDAMIQLAQLASTARCEHTIREYRKYGTSKVYIPFHLEHSQSRNPT